MWPPRIEHGRPDCADGRRRLLQVGALGFLGLSLPRFLWQRNLARADARTKQREVSCVFVLQYGGASQIDTFDPKPRAPSDIRGPYLPIATSVPGMHISSMLPRLAKAADHYCLLRSLTHSTPDHDGGMHVCMTGHSRPAASTPYLGSVVAKLRPSTKAVPPYVWLLNLDQDVVPRYLTGGVLGAGAAPLLVGRREANPAAPDFRLTEFDPPAGVSQARLQERQKFAALFDSASLEASHRTALEGFRKCREQAFEIVTGSEARAAFVLDQEPVRIRDRYGRGPLGQNLLLARRLIEAGVRLVTVNAWCGRSTDKDVLVTQGWDHHGAEVQKCGIFDDKTFGLGFVLPRFDQAVSALLEDLDARGMLATTLVVVVGEFGRTPRITRSPYPGRDHWPQCYSALLAGGGIRGGRVYGASDRIGGYVAQHPTSPEDFHATIYHALGIPAHTRFGPDGFTLRVSDGEPITSLFG